MASTSDWDWIKEEYAQLDEECMVAESDYAAYAYDEWAAAEDRADNLAVIADALGSRIQEFNDLAADAIITAHKYKRQTIMDEIECVQCEKAHDREVERVESRVNQFVIIADALAAEVDVLQRENMTMRETLKGILSLDHKQWIKHECRLNYSASTVERDELLTVLRKCLWVLEAAVCSGGLYERAVQAARKVLEEG